MSMAHVKKKKRKEKNKKQIVSGYRKLKILHISCSITVISRDVSRVSPRHS